MGDKEKKDKNAEDSKIESNEYVEDVNAEFEREMIGIKASLDNATKKADEYLDVYKRTLAEFDNYKKRLQKEKENQYNTVLADIVCDLLPIVDNFEQAIKQNKDNTENQEKNEAFKSGIQMIYKSLRDLLSKYSVEEIEALGVEFNPELHDAVMHIEDDKYSEKEVIEEFRKGYKIGEKVIRHAMVKVAN